MTQDWNRVYKYSAFSAAASGIAAFVFIENPLLANTLIGSFAGLVALAAVSIFKQDSSKKQVKKEGKQ